MYRDSFGPLADLLAKQLTARAVFLRTDGKTVVVENVNPDSIGPSGANPGVVAVEYADGTDRVVHLPFIELWTVEYR